MLLGRETTTKQTSTTKVSQVYRRRSRMTEHHTRTGGAYQAGSRAVLMNYRINRGSGTGNSGYVAGRTE